jgi:hypothetical protein
MTQAAAADDEDDAAGAELAERAADAFLHNDYNLTTVYTIFTFDLD